MKVINLRTPYGSSKDKALEPRERELLFKEVKDRKTRIILILGAYAGLRVGEMRQCRFSWLEFKDINEQEVLCINIPDEDRHVENKLKIWRPKTRKGRTTYVLNNKYAHELFAWYENNECIDMCEDHISMYVIKKKLNLILERTENLLTAHALRSTYQNYLLYECNYEPKFIAVVLGHKDIRTTMKHYNTMNKASAESYLKGVMNNGNV